MPESPAQVQLAEAVLSASNGSRVELDEQYLLTAFVVHREPHVPTPVVELLDHGPDHGAERWHASARDEFIGAATLLGCGSSAGQALRSLDWQALE